MKFYIYLIFMLFGALGSARGEHEDIESLRQHYQQLFEYDPASDDAILQFYERMGSVDERTVEHIQKEIALNDQVITRQVVSYIYSRSMIYSKSLPGMGPDNNEQVKAEYDALRAISELKPFLLNHLYSERPHYKICEVISVLYGDDEVVVGILVELGLKNEILLRKILEGIVAAGLRNDKTDALALKAISSENISLMSIASDYYTQFPSPLALPYLIGHLRRPANELSLRMDDSNVNQFYVPPAIEAFTKKVNADLAGKYIEGSLVRGDALRFGIIVALLAYDKNELEVFKEEILKAQDKVSFGPLSQGRYDALVGVFNKGVVSKRVTH